MTTKNKGAAKSKERPTLKIEGWGTRNCHGGGFALLGLQRTAYTPEITAKRRKKKNKRRKQKGRAISPSLFVLITDPCG